MGALPIKRGINLVRFIETVSPVQFLNFTRRHHQHALAQHPLWKIQEEEYSVADTLKSNGRVQSRLGMRMRWEAFFLYTECKKRLDAYAYGSHES